MKTKSKTTKSKTTKRTKTRAKPALDRMSEACVLLDAALIDFENDPHFDGMSEVVRRYFTEYVGAFVDRMSDHIALVEEAMAEVKS